MVVRISKIYFHLINLFYFFKKISRSTYIDPRIYTWNPRECDFHNLTFLFLWLKIEFKKEKRHLIGYHVFTKENHKAAMVVISQQIFLKRQNHNLLKCYKICPFHQILKPRIRSRKNLSSIHWFTRFDNYRSKNSWYN